MSGFTVPGVGRVAWVDLTVPDAAGVRDFYRHVVGWGSAEVNMGDYCDFNMLEPGSGEVTAGVCHARGVNAGLPPVWLVHVAVADLEASTARCRELGGGVVAGPSGMGSYGRYCVIRDPAGAHLALFEPARG
jgi:predicted enzyme related to lactoylglutathione lyase